MANLEFLHLDFLASAGVAVRIFNRLVNEPDARWALLFDELELAPPWIRKVLIRSLRSVDPHFLFKISLSPYSVDLKKEMDAPEGASAKADFQPIRLWYPNKEQGYPFCQALLENMQAAKGYGRKAPEELFGRSAFATDKSEWESGTAYRPDSSLGKQFSSLAENDPTFRQYLASRQIDPAKLHHVVSEKRASDLRKARSIVSLRNYFRGPEGNASRRKQGRRSRKIPTVYAGATSLFAMVEGNPRWFIGIIGELLEKSHGGRVTGPAQVRKVVESSDIFRAMLNTIPCEFADVKGTGLLSLLDPIGEFFAAAAIDEPFDPDPPCTFQVNGDCPPAVLRALGMALNAGAIVYAPVSDEPEHIVGLIGNIQGKRFRLSYILAPHYNTPIVLGRAMSLMEVLERTGRQAYDAGPTLFNLESYDEEIDGN